MSGTFEIDGSLFPTDPIEKSWQRERVASRGTGEPIFSSYWRFDMGFGTLKTSGENSFFMDKYLVGGLYTVKLPHPFNGALTVFTGVSIAEVNFRWDDVNRNYWARDSRVVLEHINLSATGT
jgi:hypothetical protein